MQKSFLMLLCGSILFFLERPPLWAESRPERPVTDNPRRRKKIQQHMKKNSKNSCERE